MKGSYLWHQLILICRSLNISWKRRFLRDAKEGGSFCFWCVIFRRNFGYRGIHGVKLGRILDEMRCDGIWWENKCSCSFIFECRCDFKIFSQKKNGKLCALSLGAWFRPLGLEENPITRHESLQKEPRSKTVAACTCSCQKVVSRVRVSSWFKDDSIRILTLWVIEGSSSVTKPETYQRKNFLSVWLWIQICLNIKFLHSLESAYIDLQLTWYPSLDECSNLAQEVTFNIQNLWTLKHHSIFLNTYLKFWGPVPRKLVTVRPLPDPVLHSRIILPFRMQSELLTYVV